LTDVVPGDAGAFSAERCGFIRGEKLAQLVNEHGFKTVIGWFHGKGGMVSLLGMNDLLEVERMVDESHEYATLCMCAMSYHLSKSITSLLPVVGGEVDGIILTGGGAYWGKLVDDIKSRVAFLGIPVYVRPGENEMRSLAEGALRVMKGEETAHVYGE
jgi:butyrate kinase